MQFENLLIEHMRRSLKPELTSLDGTVWHEPLPLELAREREPLVRLLAAALAAAGVEVHPSDVPIAARVLTTPRVALVICANESPADAVRRVSVDDHALEVPVSAYGARIAVVERQTGRVLGATSGEPLRSAQPLTQP